MIEDEILSFAGGGVDTVQMPEGSQRIFDNKTLIVRADLHHAGAWRDEPCHIGDVTVLPQPEHKLRAARVAAAPVVQGICQRAQIADDYCRLNAPVERGDVGCHRAAEGAPHAS